VVEAEDEVLEGGVVALLVFVLVRVHSGECMSVEVIEAEDEVLEGEVVVLLVLVLARVHGGECSSVEVVEADVLEGGVVELCVLVLVEDGCDRWGAYGVVAFCVLV